MTPAAAHHQNPEKQLRLLLILILCGAAVLRCYMVSLNMNILLDQGLVQDDAFYYYVIARHILEQSVSSFDGINLTNGFHPLWQAICLPVFYFWSGDTPVRVMLGIACVFDLLSLVFFYHILSRVIKNPYVVLSGVAILAFHGTIIRTWFDGLETALSIFSLLWLLHQFLNIRLKNTSTLRDHLWLGLIAAFSFLARTDNAVVIVVLFSFLYLPDFFTHREFKNGFFASGILLILVSPWLAWNILHFGSIVQISGQIRDNTWLVNSVAEPRPFYLELFYGVWTSHTFIRIVFEKMFSPVFSVPLSGFFYLALISFLIYLAKKTSPHFRNSLYALMPFITGVVLLYLYHAGVRHFVRGWYNAPVLLVFTMLISLLLDVLVAHSKNDRGEKIMLFSSCLVLLILFSPYYYTRSPDRITLDPRIAAAQWINDNTSPQVIIGAANAGIMAYYTKRTLINLDGVVNEHAFHARLANNLQQYVQQSHIDYLADHKGTLSYLCKTNLFYTCTRADNLESATWIMQINPLAPTLN